MIRKSTIGSLRTSASRIALCSLAVMASVSVAVAGPEGGVIKGGQGTISRNGDVTRVDQSSDRLIVDWRSFDIDADETVRFRQPGRSSVALNRVDSGSPTSISGALEANGNVWIVNQHGVTFNRSARVDVGGLVATTADIGNADFMAGRDLFDTPGRPGARIVNEGSITVGEAGLTALIGSHVANHGVIQGELTQVVLGGAETFAIDLAGDGLIAFQLDGQNLSTDEGPLIENSGRIVAEGGKVLLTAAAAAGIVEAAISGGGEIAVGGDGAITVDAGEGRAEISGVLAAAGGGASLGGSITVIGGQTHLTETARLDASGGAGGGSVRVGGDFQGGGDIPAARRTLVSSGAEIDASTTGARGLGGRVIVWADEATGFFGSIRATGGSEAGNGGFAEVSGKQNLAFAGFVDLSSPGGLTGELLLDPLNIEIVAAGGANDGALPTILFADNPGDDFTINASAVVAALATADVTLQAENNITVSAAIVSADASSLTLQAGNDIVLSADIDLAGNLTLSANDPGTTASGDGTIFFDGGTISAAGVTLSGEGDTSLTGSVDLVLGDINATDALMVTTTLDGVGIVGGGILNIGDVATVMATGADADVTLDNMANDFQGAVTASGRNVEIVDATDIELGDIDAGSLTVTALAGSITDGAEVGAGDDIDVTGAAALTASADIVLDDATNDFGGAVSADAVNVTLVDINGIELADIDAGSLTVTALGGSITDGGAGAAGDDVDVTGAAALTASADIVLDDATNDFDGAVDADAANVTLVDIDGIELGDVDAGSLTVTALAGSITDGADTGPERIVVTGEAILTAGAPGAFFDIALDNDTSGSRHDFQGAVSATGEDITLVNSGGIRLGDITTNSDAAADNTIPTPVGADPGRLIVRARGGEITNSPVTGDPVNDPSGVITVAGEGVFEAVSPAGVDPELRFDIELTRGENGSGVTHNDFGTLSLVGGDVFIEDASGLVLGDVRVSGDLSVRINSDNTGATSETLTQTAGGAVLVTGRLGVLTGVGATTRSDVTLANAANEFSLVRVIADDVALRDTDGFILDGADLTGDLLIGTSAARQAGSLTLQDVAADGDLGFDVTGTATLTRVAVGGNIDGVADGTITGLDLAATAGVTSLTSNTGSIDLADFALGAFSLRAPMGEIRFGSGSAGAVAVAGLAAGGDLVLHNVTLGGGALTAGGNVTADGVLSTGGLSLTSTGSAGRVLLGSVEVGGDFAASAADIRIIDAVLDPNGSGGATTDPAPATGDFLAANRLSPSATVNGVVSRTVGRSVSTPDDADLRVFQNTGTTADMTVGGHVFTNQILVTGTTELRAESIILPREQVAAGGLHNDFRGAVSATDRMRTGDDGRVGGNVFIEDASGLVLGDVRVTGDLSVRINSDNANAASETLTQTAGGAVSVTGGLGILTGVGLTTERSNVTLANAANDFDIVRAVANDLRLRDSNGFRLLGADLTGSLEVGPIFADIGTDTDRQAGNVTIEDVAADGDLGFDVTGTATLTRVAVGGNIDGVADGTITGRDIVAESGTTSLTSRNGSVILDRGSFGAAALDAGLAIDVDNIRAGGVFSATTGTNADIFAANLASSGVTNTISAGGSITVDALRVAGSLNLDAVGQVRFGSVDVGGALGAEGSAILITDMPTRDVDGALIADPGAFLVGRSIATLDDGDLRVFQNADPTTGGALGPLTFDHQVQVAGAATLNSGGDIYLPREQGPTPLHNDFGGAVSVVAGGDVAIEDVNSIAFSSVDVEGDFAVRSNAANLAATAAEAAISQTGAMTVAGASTFVTGDHDDVAIKDGVTLGDVTLENAGNSFGGDVSIVARTAEIAATGVLSVTNSRLAGSLGVSSGGAAALVDVDVAGGVGVSGATGVELTRVAVGGDLDATSASGDVGATDPRVGGATDLVATLGAVTVDDAILNATEISAGAAATLSDLIATSLIAGAGDVTLERVRADGLTLNRGAVGASGLIITGDLGIVTNGQAVLLDLVRVGGALTVATGTGAIGLRNIDVVGGASLTGGDIGFVDGASETRMRVGGALMATGSDVEFSDLSVAGQTTVTASRAANLDDASLSGLSVDAEGAVVVSDTGAGATDLDAGGTLEVRNARLATLDADAVGDLTLQAVTTTGIADLKSTEGDIKLSAVAVGGELKASADAGDVSTFAGPLTLEAFIARAPVAVSLPSFVVEGQPGATIGVEVSLPPSESEGRVLETLTASGGAVGAAVAFDQADDAGRESGETERLLTVAGKATVTAAEAISLRDSEFTSETEAAAITGGGAVSLQDAEFMATLTATSTGGTVTLTDVDVTGAATATGAGDVGIGGSGFAATLGATSTGGTVTVTDVNVAGATTVSGRGTVSLDSSEFRATLGATSTGGAATLTNVDVTGGATVTGAGNVLIRRNAGSDAKLNGTLTATSDGGTVTLTDVDVTGAAMVTGDGNVSLRRTNVGDREADDAGASSSLTAASDSGTVTLTNVDVTGAATVTALGDISLGDVEVGGVARLNTEGDVVVDDVDVGGLNVGADPRPRNFSLEDQDDDDNDTASLTIRSLGKAGNFTSVIRATENIEFLGTLNGELGTRLRLVAGNLIGFGGLVGGDGGVTRFGEIALKGTGQTDVQIGSGEDVEGPQTLQANQTEDIFFVRNLTLLQGLGTVRTVVSKEVDDVFFENKINFGVDITGTFAFAGEEGSAPSEIELTGSIGTENGEAAALSSQIQAGDRRRELRFNNCVIGDAADCGVTPGIVFTIDTDIPVPQVLEIDLDELADIYASGGNEELWAPQPAFTEDLEEE